MEVSILGYFTLVVTKYKKLQTCLICLFVLSFIKNHFITVLDRNSARKKLAKLFSCPHVLLKLKSFFSKKRVRIDVDKLTQSCLFLLSICWKSTLAKIKNIFLAWYLLYSFILWLELLFNGFQLLHYCIISQKFCYILLTIVLISDEYYILYAKKFWDKIISAMKLI